MKKVPKWVKLCLCMVVLVALGIGLFQVKRNADRETGYAHGYTAGYSIGHTDMLHGITQNDQILAGTLVPYEVGSGKWKFFIRGFSEGYQDAQSVEG